MADCRNCGHAPRDHFAQVGACNRCSCRAFKRWLGRALGLVES